MWIQRAKYLHSARAEATCWIRYEDFTDQPSIVMDELAEKIPRLRSVHPDATVQVKDYPPQKVRNMNREQISNLSKDQIQAIASALAEHREFVAGFGYDATPPN